MSGLTSERQRDLVPKLLSTELLDDEEEVLKAYQRAKKMGYADLTITIQEGKRVKLWITEKLR